MTLLHVTTRREWRGGEQQLLYLARETGPVALPADAALAARLPPTLVRPVPFRGSLWGAGALRALVRRDRPALLAVHDANGLRAALSTGLPVVAHRRVDFPPSRWAVARLRSCAGVVAVSEAVRRVLLTAGVPRVEVVRDGVEVPSGEVDPAGVRAELGLPPTAFLVLAVGALVAHKDHATAVRALAGVPGAHLVVLGEGPGRAELRREAAARWVSERVHLPGFRSDVGRWLRSVDLVVHPSREEGLGQCVLEAVGAGAVVITSDAGGLPELTGVAVRVPAGDAEALASAVRWARGANRPGRVEVRPAATMVAETRAAWSALTAAAW